VQPLVESAPSNEACAEVRDIAPPAVPAGLAVLPREGGLEILWSPSPEPDLAGYRVYRAAGDGAPERVAEVAAGRASWLDESARPGVDYRYAVTAFDAAGNESGRTEPVEATLP
jgi:fibronectin type 3 domain-containing protein